VIHKEIDICQFKELYGVFLPEINIFVVFNQ